MDFASRETPVDNEQAYETATKLRAALRELADNLQRRPDQIRERAGELAEAMDGLCEELKPEQETNE